MLVFPHVLRSNSNVPSYKPKLMQPSGLNSHLSSVCEKNFTTAVPNVEYRAPHSWNLSFDIERTPFTESNLKLSPSFREVQLIHGIFLIYLQCIDLAFYSSINTSSFNNWVTQTLESENIVMSLCLLSVLSVFFFKQCLPHTQQRVTANWISQLEEVTNFLWRSFIELPCMTEILLSNVGE